MQDADYNMCDHGLHTTERPAQAAVTLQESLLGFPADPKIIRYSLHIQISSRSGRWSHFRKESRPSAVRGRLDAISTGQRSRTARLQCAVIARAPATAQLSRPPSRSGATARLSRARSLLRQPQHIDHSMLASASPQHTRVSHVSKCLLNVGAKNCFLLNNFGGSHMVWRSRSSKPPEPQRTSLVTRIWDVSVNLT